MRREYSVVLMGFFQLVCMRSEAQAPDEPNPLAVRPYYAAKSGLRDVVCSRMSSKILGAIKPTFQKINPHEDKSVNQLLMETFEDKKISCKFSLKRDGSITQLSILESSNSPDLDKKALDFIRAAAPFDCRTYSNGVRCTIEFPSLDVRILDEPKDNNPLAGWP
jgi:TonB family protein